MKHSTLENHWDEIKGQLKQRYAQLTDDDLKFVSGKGEELLARLREKLSVPADEFDRLIEDLKAGAATRMERVKSKAGEIAGDVREKLGDAYEHVKSTGAAVVDEVKARAGAACDVARTRVRSLHEEGEDYVRQNPRQSLLAALCAGFVVGLLIRR